MKGTNKALLACVFAIAMVVSASGCVAPPSQKTLTIFNAGSLSKPFKEIGAAFEKENPGVTVQQQSAGSVETVKKVSSLNQSADVVATSDWIPIAQYLYPNFTKWYGKFASNTMVIAYTNKSKYADEINSTNWYQILTRPDVQVGRSNPDADPNGYRTLMVWELAQKYYNNATLYSQLLNQAPSKNMRQKETDLIAPLQSGQLDYAWNYESTARQNNLSYVSLPAQLNLGDPAYQSFYQTVNATSAGQQVNGSLIEYGITVPNNAQNPDLGQKFVAFVLGPEGSAIMANNSQPVIHPMQVTGTVPPLLAPYATTATTTPALATVATTEAVPANVTKTAAATGL